jgi:hypothetical protein
MDDLESASECGPNQFIDITDMRANQFKLQHFFNDIFPNNAKANSPADETETQAVEVILTR